MTTFLRSDSALLSGVHEKKPSEANCSTTKQSPLHYSIALPKPYAFQINSSPSRARRDSYARGDINANERQRNNINIMSRIMSTQTPCPAHWVRSAHQYLRNTYTFQHNQWRIYSRSAELFTHAKSTASENAHNETTELAGVRKEIRL